MIQTALNWLYDNLYNYMIPVCGLCVLRVIVAFLELGHMKRLRDKKFVFRKVSVQYRDIGAFTGLFIGSMLICLFPKLGLLFAVVAAGLTVLGYQIGKRKGDEADRIWQEVVNELAQSEDAIAKIHGSAQNTMIFGHHRVVQRVFGAIKQADIMYVNGDKDLQTIVGAINGVKVVGSYNLPDSKETAVA